MAKWQAAKLGEVSAISYGYTESASAEPVGPRFLRITDIQADGVDWGNVPFCPIESDRIDKFRLAHDDIVFARTGATTGKSYLVENPPEAVFASYLIRLRLRLDDLLPKFLNLFFQTADYWRSIEIGSTGSAQGGFNASKLGDLTIRFPPRDEQQRIVTILDEAFEGIATAKANAEKNLQNARDLSSALGESCFHQHIDDSFLPRQLADLCELIVDCEHKTAPTQGNGFPSIRTPNIGKGKLILDDVNRVSEATYVAWTRRAVPEPGDLILAREAPAGNVAVIPKGLDVCLGQRTVLIRPKRDMFEPEYLAHLLLQRSSQERLLAHSRGATVQHINMKDIRAFKISSVPALDVQRKAIEKLAEIERACEVLQASQYRKMDALEELKKSLLHQAFTGQL